MIAFFIVAGLLITAGIAFTIRLFVNEDGPQDDGWGEFNKRGDE